MPSGEKNAVNQTVNGSFSKNLNFIISISNTTQKVNGVTVLYSPNDNDTAALLGSLMDASILLTSVDVKDVDTKVWGDVLKMATETIRKFIDNNKSISQSITKNNIKYTIMIEKGMPVMLFADKVQ